VKLPGSRAKIDAQAKINLALRIKGRDANGYHPLETLFLRIELADSLSIQITSDERSILCAADLGPAEDNLAFRAASAFTRETGWPEGWVIRLEKQIPMGAGLGGGSADAGAILRTLNRMAPEPIPQERLLAVGAGLGADVPFLTADYPFALGEGYGERLTPLAAPPQRKVGLLVPHFSIDTAVAYAWLDQSAKALPERPRWDITKLSWADLEKTVENDLQGAVEGHHPEIAQAVTLFKSAGASVSGMTGSGSVIFGIFPEDREPGKISVPAGWNLLWTRTAASVVEPQLMG
jgi:4-diphosphocytidyl-2-C-methyl-D-erythritol kinase